MKQILLVRHGQASFGADDYDALSDLGHEQSRVLGRALAAAGVRPDVLVRGGQRRHAETAAGILDGLGVDGAAEVVDPRWNEFDFEQVVELHAPRFRDRAVMMAELAATGRPRQAFQEIFEVATHRWTTADGDAGYAESFPAFSARVVAGLEEVAELQPERGTAVVVTSGGPIGMAASHLIAGDASLWPALNRVMVNTSVTKVIRGGRGLSMVSFNAHTHLEGVQADGGSGLLTYR